MSASQAGLAALSARGLVPLDGGIPSIVLVPSESVRLLRVELPLASRAKRAEAAPFAIEDRIADPVEAVHVALGMEPTPRTHLVGVVRHAVMSDWIAAVEAAGLETAALVPDVLMLAVPDQGWRVAVGDGRARVRIADGTGFALPVELIAQAWRTAGSPPLLLEAGVLPDEMAAAATPAAMASRSARELAAELDLRQPPYAPRRRLGTAGQGALRRLGWIAGLGIAAHAGIAAADTLMLGVIADRRADETRALVAQLAPGANIGGDIAATANDMLPEPQRPDRFLPALSRLSAALVPVGGVATRAIRFDGTVLTMDLDAPEPGMAARVRAALVSAGMTADVAQAGPGQLRVSVRGG